MSDLEAVDVRSFGLRRVPWRALQRERIAVMVPERSRRIGGVITTPAAVVLVPRGAHGTG